MHVRPGSAGAPVNLASQLRYDDRGFLPVVLQDHTTLEVLIAAFANAEAVERTMTTGLVHLWSRSRGELWLKGESSGRLQHVVEVRPNCEMSSLLILVRQEAPGACHTGHSSCYYRRLSPDGLEEISPPVFDPSSVYSSDGQALLAQLLELYNHLRGMPVVAESSTSRVLHGQCPDPWERVQDEWEELRGVLEGTHVHKGREEDARLEAYQVLYWTSLCHVLAGGAEEQAAWASVKRGYDSGEMLDEVMWSAEVAARTREAGPLWKAFGALCRHARLDPAEVIEHDLRDLSSRPYLRQAAE